MVPLYSVISQPGGKHDSDANCRVNLVGRDSRLQLLSLLHCASSSITLPRRRLIDASAVKQAKVAPGITTELPHLSLVSEGIETPLK